MSNYLSKEAIRKLHLSGTGKKGIIYVDEDYSVYEGVENGRIRVLQRANSTLIKNSSANVNTVITNLQNQISATGVKWSDDFTVLAGSTTISLSFLANSSIKLFKFGSVLLTEVDQYTVSGTDVTFASPVLDDTKCKIAYT